MLTKRQKKKQVKDLRKRLIENDKPEENVRASNARVNGYVTDSYDNGYVTDNYDEAPGLESDMKEIKRAEKISRDKKIKIAIRVGIGAAIVVGLFFLIRLIVNGVSYSSYEVVTVAEGSGGGYIRSFGGGYIKYSTSGVKFSDSDGELIWDQGYSMENPNLIIQGDYALVYDKSGTAVYLINKDGILANYSTDNPILGAGLSKYGVSAVMVAKSAASEIYFYDNTGGKLDVEIKNVLAAESGYPLSMSLSPDGQGVALSLMFLDSGSMQTRITFINFSQTTTAADDTDRVVGYFEYADNVYPEVDYLSDSEVVAFGTDKVCFYSLSNPTSPKVSEEIPYENEIISVATGDGHAAVVSKAPEGGYKLAIYDGDGDVEGEETFAFDYTKMEIVDGYVMLYGSDNALIATTSGNLKYSGAMDGQTTSMIPLGGNEFMQVGNYGTRTIKLQ